MKGDFSRDTFDPTKHFSRVLMQQGRVLLDSDWNEQTSVLLHYLRTLAADLIGPYGGPAQELGFNVLTLNVILAPGAPVMAETERTKQLRNVNLLRNFVIGTGRYYVDGFLCENELLSTYARSANPELTQPDHSPDELENGKSYLVYLDVWERHITSLEDEAIREVALGSHGPDTATRARVVWQVKTLDLTNLNFGNPNCFNIQDNAVWIEQLEKWQSKNRGLLRAKADEPDDPNDTSPCIISPEARYRGAENQLYRVEIHRGGNVNTPATFKWSRENGSTLLPIRSVSGNRVTLEHMGRDARFSVQIGDWVEIVDDDYERRNEAEALFQVTSVNLIDMYVMLSGTPATTRPGGGGQTHQRKNQLLRRWEQKAGDKRIGGLELLDGAALIKERANGNENWLMLEDGIQIQFEPGGNYRVGDYWLIPARTATGDVEWPGEVGRPEARPPHGVNHHYAPLARISVAADGTASRTADYRRRFAPQAECPPE
jgi:hypothetical protein